MEAVKLVWERIVVTQPQPSAAALIATLLTAFALVAVRPVWDVSRHVVTIVHEGAHGVVAAAAGRRLAGIRLHSDSSGVTVSSGRPRGPGMAVTAAAGYLGPAVLGLGCAAVLATGRSVAVLWLLVICLGLLLLQIRNLFGLAVVAASAVALFVVTWQVEERVQVLAAHLITFFLLISAPRTVLELQASRRHGARGSDADQLASLTRVPAIIWVGAFQLATVGSLLVGVSLLRPRA